MLVPKQEGSAPGYAEEGRDVDMPTWLPDNVQLKDFVQNRVKILKQTDKTGKLGLEIIEQSEFKVHVRCSHPSRKHTIILEFFVVFKRNPAQHVNNYHLGPVRAWFDGHRFNLLSSAVYTYVWSVMWDIRFVSGKRAPERIIMKYISRGFMMACNKYETARMRAFAKIHGLALQSFNY